MSKKRWTRSGVKWWPSCLKLCIKKRTLVVLTDTFTKLWCRWLNFSMFRNQKNQLAITPLPKDPFHLHPTIYRKDQSLETDSGKLLAETMNWDKIIQKWRPIMKLLLSQLILYKLQLHQFRQPQRHLVKTSLRKKTLKKLGLLYLKISSKLTIKTIWVQNSHSRCPQQQAHIQGSCLLSILWILASHLVRRDVSQL